MRYARETGLQIFMYPLGAILSTDKPTADGLAVRWGMDEQDSDGKWNNQAIAAQVVLALDSIDAQQRLGIFGDPAARARVERGD